MQLAISTATAACSVALLEGEHVIAERHEVVGRGHAERLVSMIQTLPGKGRADLIWVDCGPGSFTGTRVGLAAARALALAWKVEVWGLSTLALIAAGWPGNAHALGVAVSGGHGELFVQEFAFAPLRPNRAVVSLAPPSAGLAITAHFVAGSGAETLVRARGNGESFDMLPHAADARKLPDALRNFQPQAIYVRAPDAAIA